MNEVFFLVQIKHTNGVYEKGVVVKNSLNAAIQGYHAYFGAYGYEHDANTDYVCCMVVMDDGRVVMNEVDDRRAAPEPEE